MARKLEAAEMLYGPEEILALRDETIKIRDEALRHNDFSSSVTLSHVVALLAAVAADMKAPRA